MAAGDPIALTNTLVATLNTDQALTFNAADADTSNLAQIFNYTPTGKDGKVVIGFQVANSHGAVAFSIAGGAGVFGTAAKTGSVAENTTDVIQIETGRYMLSTGKIAITCTPASGKRLTSDHALKIWVVELQ
jgi:hypothetical protein